MTGLSDVVDRLTNAPTRLALVGGDLVEVVTVLADDAHRIVAVVTAATPATDHATTPGGEFRPPAGVYGGGDVLRAVLAAMPTTDPHGFVAAAAHACDEADRANDDAHRAPIPAALATTAGLTPHEHTRRLTALTGSTR